MVALSTGDVISGLGRPLATEIEKPPLSTNEKAHIACERYAIDSKLVLNTNRKLVTLSTGDITSVSDVTELVK
jgi:hypothetical protein